jgi:hypothetical protein
MSALACLGVCEDYSTAGHDVCFKCGMLDHGHWTWSISCSCGWKSHYYEHVWANNVGLNEALGWIAFGHTGQCEERYPWQS